jgi:tetratricopeptide (TPR) repeat protein
MIKGKVIETCIIRRLQNISRYFMKNIFLLLVLMSPCSYYMEASLFDSLLKKLQSGEVEELGIFLTTNSKKYLDDPEYYVLLLNYSFLTSRNTTVVVEQGRGQEGDFALNDINTEQQVGFLGERIVYKKDVLLDGIKRTQLALNTFPNRLDIHFGIIHIAKEAGLWAVVGQQTLSVIALSKENKNSWLWGSVNKLDDDPTEFMIQNVVANCSALFNAETQEADKVLKDISLSLVENYPEHVYGYANLGALYATQKDYKNAKLYLIKALEIAPDDELVQQNLAYIKSKLE